MPDYRVVVNDSSAPPLAGLTHVRLRATEFGSANFLYKYEQLAAGLPRPLDPIQQDWLDILGSIFAIDLACPRGGEADWARRISAWIPCRDPERWRPLSTLFAETFAELTYDRLTIQFVQDAAPTPAPRQRRTPFDPADCVALFSGGVDSFVGAAVLLDQGRTPTLLTHSTGSAIPTAANFLRSRLRTAGALGSSIPITAHVRDGSNLTAESSQRARSLLFLGAAAVVAQATGLRDVFINENGVMAIHAPVTAARIGSLSTRTASPALLETFTRLASTALDTELSVQNLLQGDTKPEVVERATTLGQGSALAQTVSCWGIGRTRRHCGACAPCLMRRISFELHDVQDALYDANPFHGISDSPAERGAKDNLVHLIMFARDLVELDDAEVELEYPEILNVGRSMTRQQSLQLHRRWADQVTLIAERHAFTARLL